MPETVDCREQILSEDTRDFILNTRRESFLDTALEEMGGCRMRIGSTFSSISVGKNGIQNQNLGQFPYYSVPKCYTLLDNQAMAEAGILQIQNYPRLELQGEGVLVGIVDTGIAYGEPVFRDLAGGTRILRIWDQTIQEGTPPEGFFYGTEYTKEEINQALESENPYGEVPSRDENGHGTFLASVACGSPDVENRFTGAAPMAELAVVKLKEAKTWLRDYYLIRRDTPCYQENDVMAGIRYLDELARAQGKPLVLCLGLGTSMGSHTGASPLGRYLEELSETARRAVVTGTGNEAEKRHHFQSILPGEEEREEVEIRVDRDCPGFWMEVWSDIPNILEIGIVSPSGETGGAVSGQQGTLTYRFLFEQTTVSVTSRLAVEGTRAGMFALRFERPAEGIWKLTVRALKLGSGRYDIWLPVSEFLDGEVYFLRPDPFTTVTEPGNAWNPITVAWYNGADKSIAISSGRGYTREERIKPDFAAPGVEILGVNARGQTALRSGSSLAVGITAGAAALMLEWLALRLEQNVNTVQIKSLLMAGTQRRPDLAYPNREWGYGTLDLYQTFEELRRF